QAPDDPLTSSALFPSSKHDPGAGHNPAENLLYVCCVALQQGLDGAGIITTASLSSPKEAADRKRRPDMAVSTAIALSPEQGLSRYLSEIRKYPLLEKNEEFMLAKRWAEHQD